MLQPRNVPDQRAVQKGFTMGYDQHQQSNSSGALVAVIGVGLVLAILAIVVVAAVSLFWVRTSRMEAMVAQDRAVAELHRVGVKAQNASTNAQLEQARAAATPDSRLSFQLTIDQEGNLSVDGERIGLDELREEIAKLKDETSNAFSVRINADPECPAKHVVSVLDVCEEVGDVDYRVLSSKDSDMPADERGDNH